jgi:molybdopterin converting factor small subunit
MININLNLFGQLKEFSQEHIIALDMPHDSRIIDLFILLEHRFPQFQRYRKYVVCAVNNKFVDENYKFKDGDKIDIMPPASGG